MDVLALIKQCVIFLAGVGLVVAGILTKENYLTYIGSGLIGESTGAVFIKRPADKGVITTPETPQ